MYLDMFICLFIYSFIYFLYQCYLLDINNVIKKRMVRITLSFLIQIIVIPKITHGYLSNFGTKNLEFEI